jgi:hypothetical protein
MSDKCSYGDKCSIKRPATAMSGTQTTNQPKQVKTDNSSLSINGTKPLTGTKK